MSEENVKKIRDLDSFEELQPMTTGDFLIVASTQGEPRTNKASIKEVVDIYNAALVEDDPGSQIDDPDNPGETIKDPDLTPGIENDIDGDGEPDEKIDTTPINAGNIEDFLDPSGGIEIVEECRAKDTKAVVDCDDPNAYYKTKKLSTSGFEGFPVVKRKWGFLAEAQSFQAGILKEVFYGKGKFLNYFSSLGSMWFEGSFDENSNFDPTIFVMEEEDQYWMLFIEFGNEWVYLNPVPRYSDSSGYKEGFWLYHENLSWFMVWPEAYPWFWVDGPLPNETDPIGWVYLNPNVNGSLWINRLGEWRDISDLSVTSTGGATADPTEPGEFPSVSARPLTPPPSNPN